MKLIIPYIKSKQKSITLFFGFIIIFTVVFHLYNIPTEAVLYACALCMFITIIYFIVSFGNFKSEHMLLHDLQKDITLTIDRLPEPTNQIEKDYIELIKALFEAKQNAEFEKTKTVNDMTDYYTLWVHQIKTPISALHLLLQSEEINAAELEEQLFRIEEYVEMVMTYLRCGSEVNDFVFKSTDIDTVISASLRKYAKLFIRKRITLDYKKTEITALTDEKWLSFVIEQLLSNAIKYTHSEGKVTVCGENGNTLVIKDSGIGIAAEDLPRICERGFTGYNGRADKKSTGIGLFLCKTITDELGHDIEISSQEGIGTIVKIKFNSLDTIYE